MAKVAILIPKNSHPKNGSMGFKTCCSHPSIKLCAVCTSANAGRIVEQLQRLEPAYIAQKCADNGWKFRQVA